MAGAQKGSLERRNFRQIAAGGAAALVASAPRAEAQRTEPQSGQLARLMTKA